jgi:hypothetical protein
MPQLLCAHPDVPMPCAVRWVRVVTHREGLTGGALAAYAQAYGFAA